MTKSTLHVMAETYRNLSSVGKVLFFITVFLVVAGFTRSLQIEGMTNSGDANQMFFYQNVDAYDDFYANIYDSLVYNNTKTHYEIRSVMNSCQVSSSEQIRVVDLGCGTGHHVAELSNLGINSIGIDASQAMIRKAKELYPEIEDRFRQGDITNTTCVPPMFATHLLCMYFTVYFVKDKKKLFTNCFSWLAPGGFMAVHLVNRERFDPILPPGNPLFIVSPQKYAKERITTTRVQFNGFQYDANFRFDRNSPEIACFDEKFRFADGKVRRQEQQLFMETPEEISAIASQCGFTIHSVIDLVNCAYEYQYLYVFKKPS